MRWLGLWSSSTRVAVATVALGLAAVGGCFVEDPDCGICDPERLTLDVVAGTNYAGRPIRILGPACEGDRCPPPPSRAEYFVEEVRACEEGEDAQASPRGPDEHCRLSPLSLARGIELIFNNLLDPQSVELVRKDPAEPTRWEVYDWKTQILALHGPITRYNGDWHAGEGEKPDRVTRAVNLSCIDNLRDLGRSFDHTTEGEPCDALHPDTGLPLRMRARETDESVPITKSYRGETDSRTGECTTPEEGPDECCGVCDFELSIKVAKYGVTAPVAEGEDPGETGKLRSPNVDPGASNAAIACDPASDDVYQQCRAFIPWVDRSAEDRAHAVAWSDPNEARPSRIPDYDRLRETHPNDRPEWLERRTVPCQTDHDCTSSNAADMPGSACVGVRADDGATACDPTRSEDCIEGRCVAEWFVKCSADLETTGSQGYCRDKRYYDRGAPACHRATAAFTTLDPETGEDNLAVDAHDRLAQCDQDESGLVTAAECCREPLGSAPASGASCTATLPCDDDDDSCRCPDLETCCPAGEVCINNTCYAACDPSLQQHTEVVPRFDRDFGLPEPAWCRCTEDDPPGPCHEVVDRLCREDGDARAPIKPEREGQYAIKLVTREGGVVYDPALKGIKWMPAHLGNRRRGLIERCAEERGLIGRRNVEDGWRANDMGPAHTLADFDRALCSGSEYTLVFAVPEDDRELEYLRDKVGNTMAGHARYALETADFHVVPPGFTPGPVQSAGACGELSMRFSNKYDLSPGNLRKILIVEIDEWGDSGDVVAGGDDCTEEPELARDGVAPPCLTVDVSGHAEGELSVQIDPVRFGAVLRVGQRYALLAPGLERRADMSDPDIYAQAFWDACGMPLVHGGLVDGAAPEHLVEFEIDPPRCRDDRDLDGIELSCDNAKDFYNPDQGDIDGDFWGDVEDSCPVIFSLTNSGDSDNDGVGNDCDNCRRTVKHYNDHAEDIALPAHLWVRNVPAQDDTDRDGIGDVCDNCVQLPNCEGYGPDDPHHVGEPIRFDDESVCQRDDDGDMIGDACDGSPPLPGAAGPVGFGDDDDFDQDGLRNQVDACPRQPAAPTTCTVDDDCGADRACQDGTCNHVDTDGDGVGDVCDTCPAKANPLQIVDGALQEDDEDGDFMGFACELTDGEKRKDPRPFGFYEVSAHGYCCTTRWPGDEVLGAIAQEDPLLDRLDPWSVPIRAGCPREEEDKRDPLTRTCRRIPDVARQPGVVELPAGCDEALAEAGMTAADNVPLSDDDFGGDIVALWDRLCLLPAWDQDFDGVGDQADLCPFAFDPENLSYPSRWGSLGHACSPEVPDPYCPEEDEDGTGTGTGTGAGTETLPPLPPDKG